MRICWSCLLTHLISGGLALYFGGLISLLLGFTWAQGTYPWRSVRWTIYEAFRHELTIRRFNLGTRYRSSGSGTHHVGRIRHLRGLHASQATFVTYQTVQDQKHNSLYLYRIYDADGMAGQQRLLATRDLCPVHDR